MANSRWYPSSSQLGDPNSLQQVFQQLLTQHYALQDHVERMTKSNGATAAPATSDSPATTKILGLYIQPVDTQTLADGAMIKFDKKAGAFKVSL